MGSKWALVTGGSRGIGRAIATELAELGYNIIIVSNSAEELTDACEAMRKRYLYLHCREILLDLSREGSAQELFAKATAIADIDLLVNNAGIFSFLDIVDTPIERIERMIILHDMTIAISCRLFAESMIKRGAKGYILNLASFSLWMPFPGLALYGATKSFVRTFSIAFAKEVREHGIGITAVSPAGVATDLYGLPSSLQKLGCRLGVLISDKNCAHRSLNALWRRQKCCVPDWWNRAFIPLCILMPDWLVRFIRRKTKEYQR